MIAMEDYIRGLVDALITLEKPGEIVLEVTNAGTYKLLHEELSNIILSEEPFIDNINDMIITGYRVKIQYKGLDEIKDLYDYLVGCLDAGLEKIMKVEGGRIEFIIKCRNSYALKEFNKINEHVTIRLDEKEVMKKILPRLKNKYVKRKIEAIIKEDKEKYYEVFREESQADEVLRQLAIEEILFSTNRDEYEKMLSIKPEEAKFHQKLLRELVGCGR